MKISGSMNLRKLNKPTALCLSLIIILSMLSFLGSVALPVKAATAGSFDFGNTTIGTIANYFTTDKDASKFQLTQSGLLQSITVYFQTSGFNAKAAIYKDDNGDPSTLITQSVSQPVTASGWKTFTVPQSSLTAGYYWLCVVSDTSTSLGAMTPTSANTHTWKFAPYSGEFSSTFGTPSGYEKTVTSIYATLSASTSNPTPTPSPAPSQSLTSLPGSQIPAVSAAASSYNGIYVALNAIDNVESTSNYWGTAAVSGLPQWLKIDLGSATSINQVITHFYDGNTRAYTYYIEASVDGSSWTSVVSTKTGSGIVTDTFSQVTARYVRVTVTGNTANNAAHIEEIKIYQSTGNPTPTSTYPPTLSPTPTPTTVPTPTPSSTVTSSRMTLAGLGDDYLMFKNWNGNPSAWDSELHWFTQYHATGARLGFSFSDDSGVFSTYNYAKMNSVLTKLSSVGVKAVICEFPGVGSYFYGSAAWFNDWKQVAADFRGDSRIAAFELANEPYQSCLASNANTLSSFNAALASLIDQIRSIDPTRTIMIPIEVAILTDSSTAFHNDLVSKGIPAKGNILYDIVHPYYFQILAMDGGIDNPTDKADWYWNSYVLPEINYFGAQNVWSGEMFCWPRGANQGQNNQVYISYNDQQIFERRMINYLVTAGVGFQMWCFFSSSDQQAQIDALNNSIY
jgi:hypothetical protein